MEFQEKRSMTEAEDKYSFSQCDQINLQCGLIGHLRADMDTDGFGFFSSWFDFRKELKTDEFKKEFDEVINTLREEGDILHNRKEMLTFCLNTPQAKMKTEEDYYGVRVDTEQYSYFIRMNPNKGEYNVYIYAYRKDWVTSHIKAAAKGIRFIDPDYNTLFTLTDGAKVVITDSKGETETQPCRYIDAYHVEVGSSLYHICEFAEILQRIGCTVRPE